MSARRALPSVAATSASFWVKTPNLSFLTLRLTDATGQVHQQRLTLSGFTDWQPLTVTRFDGGKQYVHFGGADDVVWHGPAKQIEVILDIAAISGATSSSVSLDDLTLNAHAAAPTTPLGDYESTGEGWSFYPGSEFPGATGSLSYDTALPKSGAQSAKLSGDFSAGGNYVAMQRTFVPVNLTALNLWVKTSQLSGIGLRLTDATGQVHQQRLTLSGTTSWQQLNVTRFDGGTGRRLADVHLRRERDVGNRALTDLLVPAAGCRSPGRDALASAAGVSYSRLRPRELATEWAERVTDPSPTAGARRKTHSVT